MYMDWFNEGLKSKCMFGDGLELGCSLIKDVVRVPGACRASLSFALHSARMTGLDKIAALPGF